ncbi:MAG: translocation/assembly module TamB domain-containing protein, partial [Chlamydiia bacterium]|nr:translocation/assembly module TamB domain-containing protein [Chlamydiia bacterium]
MKKLSYILVSVFLLITAIVGFMQSPWGKKLALHLLAQALQQSGWVIQVGQIGGTLPQNIELKQLVLKGDGWEIEAESLHLDLSLLRLFRKEIAIRELQGEKIRWKVEKGRQPLLKKEGPLPYLLSIAHFDLKQVEPWNSHWSGSLKIKRNQTIRLQASIQTEEAPYGALEAQIKAGGSLLGPIRGDLSGKLQNLSFQGVFTTPLTQSLHFEGHVADLSQVEPILVRLDIRQTEQLEVDASFQTAQASLAKQIQGNLRAQKREESWSGTIDAKASLWEHIWQLQTDFAWSLGEPLELSSWTLTGPSASATGHWLIDPHGLIEGPMTVRIERLQDVGLPLFGIAEGTLLWQKTGSEQAVHVEMQAHQIFWGALFAEQMHLSCDAVDPFHALKGNLSINLEQGKYKELEITSASLQTARQREFSPFHLLLEGKWKTPLDLTLDGTWSYSGGNWEANLQTASGTFYHHPFLILSPIHFEKSSGAFRLSPLELQLGDGSCSATFAHEGEKTQGQLLLRHLPIDILSLNPLEVPIGGYFDLDARLLQQGEQLSAKLEASIQDLEVVGMESRETLRAIGHFEASLERDRLDIKGSLASKAPLLTVDLSLPLHLEIWPYHLAFIADREIQGRFAYDGKIEEILDFFDLGTHRLEGNMDCEFTLSHTFAFPKIKGSCHWKNGVYQNYYTGTQLQNIEAEWIGNGPRLDLIQLTAQDYQEKGTLSATGHLSLLPKDFFPFQFHVEFSHLNCVEIDLVAAEASGSVQVIGNLKEAWAKGDIAILQSILTIPDHIAKPIPRLKVVYRNPIHPVLPTPGKQPQHPYPVHLDLKVSAPEGIYITGRGLNSEWKGDFVMGGTLDSMAAKGKLELILGDFVFASRQFKLSEGSLSLTGKEHEMPHLNIAATIEEKGVAIIARLQGPLNQPQLTLQSVPALPMSSILAYLFFGQELSEINGLQALQLANAIANLSGEGPDVLENARRSLGVDRLRVITVPSGAEEGSDAIALQVGKYVAQGVLISVSQGTEDS